MAHVRKIQSSSNTPTNVFEDILPLVDYVICDVKIMDADRHLRYPMGTNTLIRKNLARLLRSSQELLIRIPLIPDINNDVGNLAALGTFLQSHRQGAPQELLPHHRLGESKYERLGRSFDMKNIPPASKKEMKEAAAVLRDFNITLVQRDDAS